MVIVKNVETLQKVGFLVAYDANALRAKTHAMETIRQGLSMTLMRQIARQLSAKGRDDDRRFT